MTKFFTRGESLLARAVAEERTPPVARSWGYRMNMPIDSFESMFEKVRAMHREGDRAGFRAEVIDSGRRATCARWGVHSGLGAGCMPLGDLSDYWVPA